MALIRIILECYREEKLKKKKIPMEYWLERIYQVFHSSNDIYQLLRKTYIPKLDTRSIKAVKRGAHFTVIPFGYIRNKLTEGTPKILIDKKAAKIVKLMYELRLENKLTVVQIFNRVKKMGYPHRHVANVSQTLLNPIHVGKFHFNGQLIDGDHEPIVSEEMFFTVTKQIMGHRQTLADRPPIMLFPLKNFVKLKEGHRSLNGSNGRRDHLYYRDTVINVRRRFSIRLSSLHAIFKGFLLQNLPTKLAWVKQNEHDFHRFFLENIDKLELINENEIMNTNGQYSQVKNLYNIDRIKDYLKERLELLLEIRKVLDRFRDKEEFDNTLMSEFSRAANWDFEDYQDQVQIQHLIFPKGLIFDEDIHQFSEPD